MRVQVSTLDWTGLEGGLPLAEARPVTVSPAGRSRNVELLRAPSLDRVAFGIGQSHGRITSARVTLPPARTVGPESGRHTSGLVTPRLGGAGMPFECPRRLPQSQGVRNQTRSAISDQLSMPPQAVVNTADTTLWSRVRVCTRDPPPSAGFPSQEGEGSLVTGGVT